MNNVLADRINFIAIKRNIRTFFEESKNGETLYLIALTCFLLNAVLAQTLFPWGGTTEKICSLIGNACLFLKTFVFDKYNRKYLLLGALLLINGFLIAQYTGYKSVTAWVILFLTAKDVDFEKILKVYVVVVCSVVSLTVAASQLDVIRDLVYINYKKEIFRHSLGGIYPTDFAALIFFAMLSYLYVDRKRLGCCKLLFCTGITCLVYIYCHTRLDCATMLMAIVGFAYLMHKPARYNLAHRYIDKGFICKFGIWSMPICAIGILALSFFYMPEYAWMEALNSLLSKRLFLGHKALIMYDFTLFGQNIFMNGNAGHLVVPSGYFFIDASYINYFLRYGAVFTLVIIGIHMACCRKYADDRFFILAIAVLSVNCAVAHHMLDIAYNLFPFALVCRREE